MKGGQLRAVSDLHVEHAENRKGVEAMEPTSYRGWPLVAGDLASFPGRLRSALGALVSRFEKANRVPGSHERHDADDPTGPSQRDAHVELRSAVSIYLIAERREGATIGQLARMGLGGQSPVVELPRVARAASELLQEGLVRVEGDTVCPVLKA